MSKNPEPLRHGRRAYVLDCETTGLNPTGKCGDEPSEPDEILSVAIVRFDDSEVLFNRMFGVKRKSCWPKAQEKNGISPEMVAGLPPVDGSLDELSAILGAATEIVAYNAPFDLEFLKEAGVEVNPESKITDTMLQFAEAYAEPDPKHPGECRWKKLVFAAEHVGYDWEAGAPHEALGDVYATIAVQKWLDEN